MDVNLSVSVLARRLSQFTIRGNDLDADGDKCDARCRFSGVPTAMDSVPAERSWSVRQSLAHWTHRCNSWLGEGAESRQFDSPSIDRAVRTRYLDIFKCMLRH